ncbi:MFS transporter [Falsirhodobacter xinxiangensis]|uniref:MFS transporter n=1 Tax=Falsirhodobacter xinxiangensis TaxID=2530049 RepID=UPI0010AA2164|nr:MFS transporter [Rhodobacter xinxiangensis]
MQRFPLSAMTVYGSVAASLFSASSAVPTPLYRIYQQHMHLTSVHVTMIFACYVITLLAALLIAGRLSDHLGRKPMIGLALAMNLAGMVLFTAAGSFEALMLARLVQGLAVGLALPTCGAAIIDANPRLGPTLNAVTPFAGLTVGAVGAGLVAAYAPMPLVLPYLTAAGIAAALLVMLPMMPETGTPRSGAMRSMLPQVAVPRAARGMLLRIMPITGAGWALGGLYMSLMPGLIADATGIASPLLGGSVIGALMSMATLSSFIARRHPPQRVLAFGAAALTLGIAGSLTGIISGDAVPLVVGTAVAGLGQGSVFSSALRLLMPMAEDRDRAGLLSAFFVLSYLCFAGPTVLAGWAVSVFGPVTTVTVYGCTVVAMAAISVAALRVPVLTPQRPAV